MTVELLDPPRGWPRLLLERARTVDPAAGLEAAQAAGAWRAWRSVVEAADPEGLITVVAEAGLRGRGGAGFPTAEKWRACRHAAADRRYVVANGFEADPSAQTDRTLMERDPHAVVEGTALAAFAVGAAEAFICVKGSYRLAVERLTAAVREAEEVGLIGSAAMDGAFDLHIEVRPISGSFVLGEETVLLRALEGKRAQPDQRPPYPAVRGLFGRPTVVNNVETLALVPAIVERGAAAFARIGGRAAPGPTLVQISGAVARPGIVEAPLGVRLADLLQAAGGAVGRTKAVLVGGPSGGLLPPSALSTRLAPDPLAEAGAILGSGTLLVADDSSCLVDLATLMTRYLADEACGKTIPCRIGTQRLGEIGERATSGRARPSDPQLLLDLAEDVRDGALCALELTATNPLLSGVRYFAEEFEDHFARGTCPTGVCRPLGAPAPRPSPVTR